MDFEIKNLEKNIVSVARELGYVIIDSKEGGEYNLVKKLSGENYPRFHAYVRQSFAIAQDQSRRKENNRRDWLYGAGA